MNIFLLSLVLLAQDKVLLKHQPKAGDKLSVVEKMEMNVHLVVTANGQKVELDVAQRESKKTLMDCQSVEAGQVTKATYKIEEAIEEKKAPGGTDFERAEKPMHGKTIVAERKDGKVTHKGAEGLTEKDLKDFSLDDSFSEAFPKKPVAVGESWEVGAEELKKMFHDPSLGGKMRLTLKELKEIDGRKCAVLDATLSMKGKAEEGIDIGMDAKGPVVVWIDRGYTLSAKLEGTMTMTGKTPDATMEGKGPITVDMKASIP